MKWSRARFILDSGEVIHFQDMRMFGRIDAVPSGELEGRPGVSLEELALRNGLKP